VKFTLERHREMLANARRHLAQLEFAAKRASDDFEEAARRVEKYAAQIAEAERRGVAAFDSERFGRRWVKRATAPTR
jgi:hypothetical protein